jgi:mono/diheme cytochrome c family protein
MGTIMKKHIILSSSLVLALLSVLVLATAAKASSNAQEDVVSHGEYIANIAGCIDCHTPFQKEYQDPAQMSLDQLKLLSFNLGATQDRDNKLLAGGRPFDLGPAGVLLTRNLTPDQDTGLGGWTDEQIRIAVRTGINSEGRLLFPVMPYHVYNSMADSDLDALIAYLRTIKPVENNIPKSTIPTDGFPSPTYQTGLVAPDASDKAARGSYLVNSIMGCTDCHTPVDPVTGAPQMDRYLAGRQPYEGPWGIVYGGNITPDNETGIGTWSEEEIIRAITSGVSKDGRRLILMPWFNYVTLKAEDAEAVAYYLKNVLPAVNNEIPAPSLNEGFEEMAPAESGQAATVKAAMSPVVLVIAAVGVILLVSLLAYFFRRRTA